METDDQIDRKREYQKILPKTELEFHFATTESDWGNLDINPELLEKLRRYDLKKDTRGKPIYDQQGNLIGYSSSLWSLLSYYTKDIRLGNISYARGEMDYCVYYLKLAGDFLETGLGEPFLISLSRAVTQLEISQSKGGFLRKQMNTLRTEKMYGEMDPPKKTLFSKGKSNNGGYQ